MLAVEGARVERRHEDVERGGCQPHRAAGDEVPPHASIVLGDRLIVLRAVLLLRDAVVVDRVADVLVDACDQEGAAGGAPEQADDRATAAIPAPDAGP